MGMRRLVQLVNSTAQLTFEEVLLLLRALEDARDTQDVLLEEVLVDELTLSSADVDGFRETFVAESFEGALTTPALQRCLMIVYGDEAQRDPVLVAAEQVYTFAKQVRQETDALWTSLFEPNAKLEPSDAAELEALAHMGEDAAAEHLGLRFPEFLLVMKQALAERRKRSR